VPTRAHLYSAARALNQFFFCCKPGQKQRGSRFFSFLSSFLPSSPPLVPYNKLTTYVPGCVAVCSVSADSNSPAEIEAANENGNGGPQIQFNFTRDDSSNKKRNKFNIFYLARGIFLLLSLLRLLPFCTLPYSLQLQLSVKCLVFIPPPTTSPL